MLVPMLFERQAAEILRQLRKEQVMRDDEQHHVGLADGLQRDFIVLGMEPRVNARRVDDFETVPFVRRRSIRRDARCNLDVLPPR